MNIKLQVGWASVNAAIQSGCQRKTPSRKLSIYNILEHTLHENLVKIHVKDSHNGSTPRGESK